MEHVVYNGVDLAERFIVIGVERPLPTPTPSMQLVHGGNRNFFKGMDFVPPTLSFRLVTKELDKFGRRDELRWLASVLLVDEPVKVQFSSDNGKWYKAVPSGDLTFHEFVKSGYIDVSLTCEQAAMFGLEKSASSSDGVATFAVDGNAPTTLLIEATSAVRESNSDYRFGYTLDNGMVQYAEIGTSYNDVIMDGEKRLVTVNGSVRQLTLQSDWFEVKPGTHTVERTLGSGQFTVSWLERWL